MAFAIAFVFGCFALKLHFDGKFTDLGQHVIHLKMPIHAKSFEPALIAFQVISYFVNADIFNSVCW